MFSLAVRWQFQETSQASEVASSFMSSFVVTPQSVYSSILPLRFEIFPPLLIVFFIYLNFLSVFPELLKYYFGDPLESQKITITSLLPIYWIYAYHVIIITCRIISTPSLSVIKRITWPVWDSVRAGITQHDRRFS